LIAFDSVRFIFNQNQCKFHLINASVFSYHKLCLCLRNI